MSEWPGLHRLVYVSSCARWADEGAVSSMLATERERNQQLEITGLLIHSGSGFFQILEGAETRLWELYEAIRHDLTRQACVLLCFEPILKRDFPDWPMGFKGLSRDEFREAGFNDIFQAESLGSVDGKASHLALTFLREFDHENWAA